MLRRRIVRREEFNTGDLVQWRWGRKDGNEYFGLVIDKRDYMGVWVYTVMFESKTVSGFSPEELMKVRIL